MSRRNVIVGTVNGLHARPAGLFAKAVAESGIRLHIGREGANTVDARSLLGIMTLDLKHGETVVLSADDSASDEVLDTLAALLASELDTPTS
jgi:phosphocarrier protein HPr